MDGGSRQRRKVDRKKKPEKKSKLDISREKKGDRERVLGNPK
jgi:hypothetical protein